MRQLWNMGTSIGCKLEFVSYLLSGSLLLNAVITESHPEKYGTFVTSILVPFLHNTKGKLHSYPFLFIEFNLLYIE